VVISHGVLHHTFDARRAFARICGKVKPGGIVMVGLYNSFGRIPTWVRSKLIGVFGNKIDYVVRSRIHDARKADIWVQDQYFNPHETWHSLDEVQRFRERGRAPRSPPAIPEPTVKPPATCRPTSPAALPAGGDAAVVDRNHCAKAPV
jgi:hypothetical protein